MLTALTCVAVEPNSFRNLAGDCFHLKLRRDAIAEVLGFKIACNRSGIHLMRFDSAIVFVDAREMTEVASRK